MPILTKSYRLKKKLHLKEVINLALKQSVYDYIENIQGEVDESRFCLRNFIEKICDVYKAKSVGVLGYIQDEKKVEKCIWHTKNGGLQYNKLFHVNNIEHLRNNIIETLNKLNNDTPTQACEIKVNGKLIPYDLIRIPRLYEENINKRHFFLCIVDSAFNYSFVGPGDNNVIICDAWINYYFGLERYYQAKLKIGLNRLHKNSRKNIFKSINVLKYTFGIEKILEIKDLLIKNNMPQKQTLLSHWSVGFPAYSPETRTIEFGKIVKYEDFHCCSYPYWPYCNKENNGTEAVGENYFDENNRNIDNVELLCKLVCLENINENNVGIIYTGNQNVDTDEFILQDDVKAVLRNLSVAVLSQVKAENNLVERNRMLLSFFLNRFLTNDLDEAFSFWVSDIPSKSESSMAISSVAKIGRFVLTNIEMSEDIIKSIIWMLGEYTHSALKLPHRIDIQHHLLQVARSDLPLYILQRFYRDHFFHPMEVCFLGHFLIDSPDMLFKERIKNTSYYKKMASKLKRGTDPTKEFLKIWYFASLLHDVGYAINVLKGTINHLTFFSSSKILKSQNENIDSQIKNLSKKIKKIDKDKYNSVDEPGGDHGIFGAVYLKDLLKKINEDGEAFDPEIYAAAIDAIEQHNSRKFKISFNENPIAFLLVLCDTIQEWNRTQFEYSSAPNKFYERIHSNKRKVVFSGLIERVSVNKVGNTLNIKLFFKYDINWNSGVFNLWLDSSYNLQRLDFNNLPINIKIEIITPVYISKTGKKELQIHRLRDAVSETHMEFIKNWFPKKLDAQSVVHNNAISYFFKGDEGERGLEHLLIDIKKLTESRKLSGSIDKFRKNITRWKNYNEDRSFLGDYGLPKFPS